MIMKKIIFSFMLMISYVFAIAQSKNFIDQPNIEVTGKYDTLITPNEIYLKIIISEKDNRGKVSVEQQEKNMIEVLKKLDINTEKDLSVSDMSSNFKFYVLKKTDIFTSKEYSLKVKDAKILSRVFVALEAIGISNTSIEKVAHSDFDAIVLEAKSKAVENAKQKAWILVKPLNQSIGNAIHITDYENNYMPYRADAMVLKVRGLNTASEEAAPANIDFEKIKISASVNVTFILK